MPKVKASRKASKPRVAPTAEPIGASFSSLERCRLQLPSHQPASIESRTAAAVIR